MNEKIERLQPRLLKQFQHILEQHKLAHAYLFEGARGTGKKEIALWLAASLLCVNKQDGKACGKCVNCVRVFEHQHPDVMEVAPDGLSIKVEQVRDLKAEFVKSGVESDQKIFIIEDAEKMTAGAANSLLKFLEEPDGKVTAFLLTTAKQRLLPTILSRCQLVHFSPLPKPILIQELEDKGISQNQAALLVHLTNDIEKAAALSEDETFAIQRELIWKWFKWLTKQDDEAFIFVQTDLLQYFKEREQYKLALSLLLLLYRDALKLFYGQQADELAFPRYEQELRQFIAQKSSKQLTEAIEEILLSQKKLESNVNAQGVFEQLAIRLMQKLSKPLSSLT